MAATSNNMADSNYPTSIDTNPGDPSASETLAAGNHAFLHGFAQDAIINIQNYVGAIGSSVTSSLTYIINHLIPTLSVGAILYSNASNVLSALGIGSTGQYLSVVGGLPAWVSAPFPTGVVLPYVSATVPNSSWLFCDAAAYSTLAQPGLALVSKGNFGLGTLVPATYAASVLTAVAHGLANGQIVFFTGSLPSPLATNTVYYVISQTTNTFQVSTTSGGSAVSITGTGSLSYSSQFLVPDLRSRLPIGVGTGTKVATIASVAGNVITATGLTNANNNEFQTGEQAVFGATVAGNLTNGVTYFIVRVTNTTFSLATTLANAQAGTLITLAGTERGTFTLTLSTRTLADTGGEENHSQSLTELALHVHTGSPNVAISNATGSTTGGTGSNTGSAGSSAPANVMNPFVALQYIIKT